MSDNYIAHFEHIIKKMFNLMKYDIRGNRGNYQSSVDPGFDFVADGPEKYYVESKFYRSRQISSKTMREIANRLAYALRSKEDAHGLIITNAVLSRKLIDDILKEYGILTWDRSSVFNFLTEHDMELRDEFEHLLLAAQQGLEISDVFDGTMVAEPQVKYVIQSSKFHHQPLNKGEKLCERLKSISCGKDGWKDYENVCKEIIEFLFFEDLTLYQKQSRTEDGLSRFDLVCRIASPDDYWKALVTSFNTRFVLFEFKNYCSPVTQDQVYTTERYLYTRGLRSVAFIVTTVEPSPGAITAAKGALKENGKLIMFITNADLCAMLRLKDKGESSNDYLSNCLDNWLISLSR